MAKRKSEDTTTKATPALEGRNRGEAAALTFGALVAHLRHAVAVGDDLDVDLTGLHTKIPRSWVGPYAALKTMIAEKVAPTEKQLAGRVRVDNELREAIRDGGPLREAATEMLAHLRELPDVRGAGGIGGHRGARRIKVTHNGHVGGGWRPAKPRPVTVAGVTLYPGTELELVVSDREFLQWRAKRSTDVEILEGEERRAPAEL